MATGTLVRAAARALLAATPALTAHPAAAADATALAAFVATLDAPALRVREAVEARLRTRLTAQPEDGPFAFWVAATASVPGVTVTAVDYRQPVPGGTATAGPLLVLDVAATPCLPRASVARAVPGLRFSGRTPHDGSDARATWSREEGGVQTSFGFPVRGPDCLRSLVLSLDRP